MLFGYLYLGEDMLLFWAFLIASIVCAVCGMFIIFCYMQFWSAIRKEGLIIPPDYRDDYIRISCFSAWRKLPAERRTIIVRIGAFVGPFSGLFLAGSAIFPLFAYAQIARFLS